MRIAIGAVLGTLGGPATYARELVRALAEIDTANEYVVITDRPEALDVSAPNVRYAHAPLPSVLLQPLWDHVAVPRLVRRYRVDLYHGTKGTLPVWSRVPAVVTIHDLAVYQQPETFAWPQRLHLRSHTPLAVRRAARIIADSESGRQDLLRRFALSSSQVTVIPLAANPLFTQHPGPDDAAVAARLGLPERFILYAGTIQPRKNVDALVEAFAGLTERRGVALVLTGRVRPGYAPRFLTQALADVRYLGPIDDRSLAVLYRRALALCSPSSYEGFGLSLLEAMASGCLVIAGGNSSVPELVSDGGILLRELSVPALRAALQRVICDDGSLNELRTRALQRAASYSWQETARRTLAVYRTVIDNGRAS